jgi:hypothetical protein
MAKKQEDLGRQGDLGTQKPVEKPGEVGKQGGDIGKQGGMPEKKEWEKEKGGVGTSHEPGRTPTENPPR